MRKQEDAEMQKCNLRETQKYNCLAQSSCKDAMRYQIGEKRGGMQMSPIFATEKLPSQDLE